MLSQRDLELMRETQAAALPNTCIRRRTTLVQNPSGSWVPEVPPDEKEYPCRLSWFRRQAGEFLQGGVATGSMYVVITLPYGSDVHRLDTLIVDDHEYEVIGVTSMGKWETAVRCQCELDDAHRS